MERKTHIMRVHRFAWEQLGRSAIRASSENTGKLARLPKAAVSLSLQHSFPSSCWHKHLCKNVVNQPQLKLT